MTPRCACCGAGGLPPESCFCLRCGAPLGTSAAQAGGYTPDHLAEVLARRSAREGERKEVTVLVADIAGSLAMAHRIDPEDLHALMDGLFALALDAVHAEHGTINQFRGDGFMALFGAPLARPHHARDAVRAALAIRRAAAGYARLVDERYGVPLLLRMGIHSGPVWVGSIGDHLRRDYTAEGPTVGLAARLEQAAAPGRIVISSVTARRVRGFCELRPLGALPVRGSPEPAEAFEVLGGAGHESTLDAERASGLAPFVGRVAEIATVLARLEAVPPGSARWIELVGEPGIGKSRLADEIRLREGGSWLEGRCHEAAESRAYDAWLDLLRRWPTTDRAAALAVACQLDGRAGAVDPPACEEAVRVLLDAHGGPTGRPVTILLEDVQWLDGSSLRLASALLERPPAAGICFLVTRSSEPGGRGDGPARAERIPLEPLGAEHAYAIALGSLTMREDPEALALLAAERAGGNPLYVLEVARTLAEGDEELRTAARLEASWRRARVRLPDTLRGVIAARIDALSEGAKRLLEAAAVFGKPFAPGLLARLAGEDPEPVREALVPLIERSLLVPCGAGALDFGHQMHRQVAYEQILLARRREMHRRSAVLLEESEELPSAERASEIGRHFDQGDEPRLAARALATAGKGYLALYAVREAVSHLRRAWELLRAPPLAGSESALTVRVGIALARALNTLDRAGEAAAVLDSLAPGELPHEDRVRLAEAWVEGAWVRFAEGGEGVHARALLERGLELGRGDRALLGRAHAYRIRMCHLDGEIASAAESARWITEQASAAGDRAGIAFGLGNEGYAWCDTGALDLALTRCQEALALAREARLDVVQALAAGWLAKAHAFRGECEAALGAAELARELGSRTAQVSAVYNAALWTGYVYLLQDEPKRAAEVLERLAEINPRWPTTLDWLALARLECGRFGEAADLARRCLDARPPRLVRLRALRTLGLALGLAPHPDRQSAEHAVEESLRLAADLGLRPHAADAYAAYVDLCRRFGGERRAEYYAARAHAEWQECGMVLHATRMGVGRGLRAVVTPELSDRAAQGLGREGLGEDTGRLDRADIEAPARDQERRGPAAARAQDADQLEPGAAR